MDPGPLKRKLERCADGPFEGTDFSIGHRGAALQFPEHTAEAYMAGAWMGAGILECDVTFTKDRQLFLYSGRAIERDATKVLFTKALPAEN